MSLAHSLRISVCFMVGQYHRQIDVTVPQAASLTELAPRCAQLCQAPRISKRWQAASTIGQPLDMDSPIADTDIVDGDTVILSPRDELRPPVIRDSAESLASTKDTSKLQGHLATAVVCSQIATAFLIAALTWWWAGMVAAAVIGIAIVMWRPNLKIVTLSTVFSAAASTALAVAFGLVPETELSAQWMNLTSGEVGWTIVSSLSVGVVTLALAGCVGAVSARSGAAAVTIAVIGSASTVGLVVAGAISESNPVQSLAAATISVSILSLLMAPMVATKVSGIPVPRIPTAGQDLGLNDSKDTALPAITRKTASSGTTRSQYEADKRAAQAQRTHHIHAGIIIGISICLIPALCVIAQAGSAYGQALCLAVAGAVLLHAARHHENSASWALLAVGLTAVISAAMTVWAGFDHPVGIAVAGASCVAAATSPLWAPKIHELEPTTMVWWERAESLAVAACLPLAIHLMGIFTLIRGLG